MAKVTANNILSGSINTDKLDSSVVNNLTTATTANNTATSALATAQAAYNSANTTGSSLSNLPPVISSVTITNSSWTPLDDTAANTTGGYCVITGSGFVSGATVIFGTTSASAVTFANSTSLRVQVPTLSAASYPTYVVNPSGATAIKVNGLTTSSFPVWGTAATLANTAANTAFSVSLSANSDSSITYANTTALPAGTTLAANGYFSGTVSIGTETTYTFNVNATDAEYQNALRTFSLTVTVTPAGYSLWTAGFYGNTGLNDATSRSSPTQVGALTTWSSINGSSGTLLAIKTDGTLWTWGQGASGKTGMNDAITRSSPVQIGALTNWSSVVCAQGHSLALKTDGSMWAWGRSSLGGTCGFNDIVDRSSPVQVGAATDWAGLGNNGGVNAGFNCLATKTNGTLWSWGRNHVGQVGLNTSGTAETGRSSPTQVGALTNWLSTEGKLSVGAGHNLAVKSDGTLWTWGYNGQGQLGTNDIVYRSSPVQIGAGTTWLTANAGWYGSFAIKTDGTLWSWGRNIYGQLGLNINAAATPAYRSSPAQVGSDTTWAAIKGGVSGNIIATKTDGTLWSWGMNGYGQANSDRVYRSSPVQIGALTTWATAGNKIASHSGVIFAMK